MNPIRLIHAKPRCAAFLLLLASTALAAQQPTPTTADQAPKTDTSYIDPAGTAHVTRVVPVPQDLSIQSQHFLSHAEPDQGPPQSLADRRKGTARSG